MIDVTEIEKRVDKAVAAPVPVSAELGGVRLENLGQVMEFAKLMSLAGAAVPKWLRGNPGGCLAICSRALRWQMDPFAVAEKSYLAIGKGGVEHIGYESQLIHAVITANAPLKGRLRSAIIGAGDERRCKVWGTFRGEATPHEYTSETLGKKVAAIGVNDKGELKGSPLWRTDPEVQLTYSAVRQWCRLHSSDTILGVYTPDELDATPVDDASSMVNSLSQRLRDAKMASVGARGFDPAHVASVIEGETNQEAEGDENKPRDESRRMDDPNRRDGVADKKGSDRGGEKPEAPRTDVARQRAETKSASQGEIFGRNPPQEDRPNSPRGYVSKPSIRKPPQKGRR